MLVWAGIRTSDPRSRQSWDQWRVVGRQQAPIFRSRDLYGPIRGQYCVHMISIDKSEASIQYARGQLLHADLCCQLLIGHLIPHPPSHVHNLTQERTVHRSLMYA